MGPPGLAESQPAVPRPLLGHQPGRRARRELAGFVIGFLSPSQPEAAYIHFTGIGPAWRRSGLARRLYEQFFERARRDGRTVVKAITSADNDGSIAFHRAMGFTASEPIKDYDGPSLDRVVFVRSL